MNNENATRDLRTETQYRSIDLDRAAINADDRMVPASLSSEYEVERWFGTEVLSHAEGAFNLARAEHGLPLLWNHNPDQPIGRVDSIRIDGGKLRGVLRFSKNAKAEEVWNDVRDGFLSSISIGYRIVDWEEQPNNRVFVTQTELLETSLVSVPADHTVGIGRSLISQPLEVAMTTETPAIVADQPVMPATAPPVVELSTIRRDHEIVAAKARQDAVQSERKRVSDVGSVFDLSVIPRTAEMSALRARAIDDGWSADQTRDVVLRALGELSASVVDHRSVNDDALGIHHEQDVSQRSKDGSKETRATVSEDGLDKFKTGVSQAFAVRAGLDTSREAVSKAREGGFIGMRMLRMAEQYLRLAGINPNGLNDDQIIQRALMTRASGMTTSDFSNLLVNTAQKALLQGWEQTPETWSMWTRRGQVPDFKQATRTGLSGFTSLAVVPEDGEITYGKFTDRKETIQAVSYAKKFRLTYQSIKNDDLNAFTAIPRGMGRGAQSVIGDIVYNILEGTGPTLNQDSTALFDTSSHKNYVAAATAPNVTTLDTAFTAMAKQTDPNHGKALNIRPKYLLVPAALETTARVLVTSQYDPAASPGSTTGKNTMAPNPFQSRLEVISDARMDSQTNGTAAWYLAADPNMFDTVEVAFVDGIAEPYLQEEMEWDTRGVEWVVGVDFGVAALDFRGLHKYKGNT